MPHNLPSVPFGTKLSIPSRARRPSLPISPQFQPHSTMALHRASRPRRTAETRSSSSSFSFAARCASHACSSDCAAPSLDDEEPGGVKELSESCDASPPDEPSEPMKESRVGFWFLESLMRRVTLSPKYLSLAKKRRNAMRGRAGKGRMNEQDFTISYDVSNFVLEVFERAQLFLPGLDADRVTT